MFINFNNIIIVKFQIQLCQIGLNKLINMKCIGDLLDIKVKLVIMFYIGNWAKMLGLWAQ